MAALLPVLVICFTILLVLGLLGSLLAISVAIGIGLTTWSFYVYDSWVLALRILAGISFALGVFFFFPRALKQARREEREKELQKEHVTLIGVSPLPKPKVNLLHRFVFWLRGE
jgi:O-antigen ligase